MDAQWLEAEDAELLAAYARYIEDMRRLQGKHWSELNDLQEKIHSLHRELVRRGLWPFSG